MKLLPPRIDVILGKVDLRFVKGLITLKLKIRGFGVSLDNAFSIRII